MSSPLARYPREYALAQQSTPAAEVTEEVGAGGDQALAQGAALL